MIEYARIEIEEATYPIPCHFTVFKVTFRTAQEESFKRKLKEEERDRKSYGDFSSHILTSPKELRKLLREQKSPLILMCILDSEAKKSELAQKFLRMRAVGKFSGENPNHNNHLFHDIVFSK